MIDTLTIQNSERLDVSFGLMNGVCSPTFLLIQKQNVFFARNVGTELMLRNLTMIDKRSSEIWNGINIAGGANLVVTESTFQGNTNILVRQFLLLLNP
jgi:hypothetical protein